MKASQLRVNHHLYPLGVAMSPLILSWKGHQEEATLRIYEEDFLIYEESGEFDEHGTMVDLQLTPRTQYCFEVESEEGLSEPCYFETGKMLEPWDAKWIYAPFDKDICPVFKKTFHLDEDIVKARLYHHGKGNYVVYLDGKRISDEYLMPGYHAYNYFKQVMCHALTLEAGDHELVVMMGKGWYKGRFVFDGGESDIYTDTMKWIGELHLDYEDGIHEVIVSDDKWVVSKSTVLDSSIYDGEIVDDRIELSFEPVLTSTEELDMLVDRINPRILKHHAFKPQLIKTPKDELVLDFGQNMTGFVGFENHFPKDTSILLTYGEVLQEGCFYRDNLRAAKAIYQYTSNGEGGYVEPLFTFYGFQYVKVEGVKDIDPSWFTGYGISSELERIGEIHTSHPKINQLIHNAIWGQMDNFLDIPTDCPQRDERMGWTGDAAIISRTATQNFDMSAFFHHYLVNMAYEQSTRNGSVPNFVPVPPLKDPVAVNPFFADTSKGMAIWGDAASFIPYFLYMANGDLAQLECHYGNMQDWVEYVITRLDEDYLWTKDMQLGDWLAQDTNDPQGLFGATDLGYTASAYFYYTLSLIESVSHDLGYGEDEEKYHQLKEKVKASIIDHYFDERGAFTIQPTQCGCALALYFEIYDEVTYPYLIQTMRQLVEKKQGHLDTGFAGTPFLLLALSKHHLDDLAYTILLQEDLPSWLFAVNLGATTVWERWNSLLEDGSISGTGMNSLNHYAYGSVMDWMYRYMGGLNPIVAGYQEVMIDPHYDQRLEEVSVTYKSASGEYRIHYRFLSEHEVKLHLHIPENCKAHYKDKTLSKGDYYFTEAV